MRKSSQVLQTQNVRRTWISAFAAVLILGCGSDSAEPYSPGRPSVPPRDEFGPPVSRDVWLSPMDGATDVGETPIGFRIGWSGLLSAEEIEMLSSSISLVDSMGREVPIVFGGSDMDLGGADSSAMVAFLPDRPLQTGWYTMTASLPEGYRRADMGPGMSRFRVGSEPRVWGLRACMETERVVAFVDLSERVLRPREEPVLRFDGIPCHLSETLADAAGEYDEPTLESLRFDCPTTRLPVSIDIGGMNALMGATGTPVTTPVTDVDVDAEPHEGCIGVRVPPVVLR